MEKDLAVEKEGNMCKGVKFPREQWDETTISSETRNPLSVWRGPTTAVVVWGTGLLAKLRDRTGGRTLRWS